MLCISLSLRLGLSGFVILFVSYLCFGLFCSYFCGVFNLCGVCVSVFICVNVCFVLIFCLYCSCVRFCLM